MPNNINFDLKHIPFSRYGSYFAFSELPAQDERKAGLYMRTVNWRALRREILRIELFVGDEVFQPLVTAAPSHMTLTSGSDEANSKADGRAAVCIAETNLVRIRATGVGVRLAMDAGTFDYAMSLGKGVYEVNSFQTRQKYRLAALRGHLKVESPWHGTKADHVVVDLIPDDSGACEIAIEAYDSTWAPRGYDQPFEDCLVEVEAEFKIWRDASLQVPDTYAEAGELAAYVNWSGVVLPDGYLTRPAMLMSKNWMIKLWSWDHCFNAMATVRQNPALAWDQLMLMVDNQDAAGAFPDSITATEKIWNFCKPPIHGWALRYMMRHSDWVTSERLAEIYRPLCHWTEWWFSARDDDGDGIPQYNHGNDSGWDNCTAFEVGPPVEAADLSAYLVLQMDVLAEVAGILGLDEEARDWTWRADALLERLIEHSWRGDRFVAPRSGDHAVFESDTLLHYLPVVLGVRLPLKVREHLIAGLKEHGRFRTEHGFATESVRSPLYEADGYWRGPIWAPETLILIDGLAAAGEVDFAREMARRFCDMAARSGMAENYDALTGEGLRDRAYTWTSSVFLILAHDYLSE